MALIINGKPFATSIPVKDYLSHPSMEIKPWLGAKPRRELIDLLVLHWTAGEGSAQQVHRVLQGRKLGVEFIIDREGCIWQCCDPCKVDALDAGRFNARSIGVEVVNYGMVWPASKKPPKKGRDRPTSKQTIHGKERKNVAAFYPAQVDSVLRLVTMLLEAFPDIEPTVPLDGQGRLVTGKLSRVEANAYRGIVGHYHLSRRKTDPGIDLMQMVGGLVGAL